MGKLSWKLGAAFSAFLVGVVLSFTWLKFESGSPKSNELSSPPETEVKPPPVEAKTVNSNDASYLQGKKDAERDLKAGRFIIKVKGQTRFGMVLEEEMSKHKVKIESIGCFFSEEDEKRLRGYNEVSKTRIAEKIGKTVLEEAMRKATERDGDASR